MDPPALTLVPFTGAHVAALLPWVTSERDMLVWAGPEFTWPLDEAQLLSYARRAGGGAPGTGAMAVLGQPDGPPLGHLQLRVDAHHGTGHICRVLIAPDLRGRGLGDRLIGHVVRSAFDELGLHRLSLSVYDFNHAAIACYRRQGFLEEGRQRQSTRCGDERWDAVLMSRLRTDPAPDAAFTRP